MADESKTVGSDQSESGSSGAADVTATTEPGWYGTGTNPNEQSYWDGQQWSGVRHWAAGQGWIEGAAGGQAEAPPRGVESHRSPNPYVQQAVAPGRARKTRLPTPATFSLGVLVTMVAGVALMYGSVGTWVHVDANLGVANFHVSINGLDQGISTLIGVNGYVTFIGGIVLLVLGGLAMSSEETLLVALTTIASLAILVFAIYDMFRIVQKISALPASVNPSVSVGWGLICVLSAAVLAMIVSVARLLGQR